MRLVGVVLVTNGSRGPQLLFSYPPPHAPLPKVLNEETSPYARLVQVRRDSSISSSLPLSEDASCETLFGMPLHVLADLLSPNPTLFNQNFDLLVDDLQFIGRPVVCPSAPPQEPSEDGSEEAEDEETSTSSGHHKLYEEINMFNVVFVLKEAENDERPLGNGENGCDTCSFRDKGNEEDDGEDLVTLQASIQTDLSARYTETAARLSHVLLHEQIRCGFISREVQRIMHIREVSARPNGNKGVLADTHTVTDTMLQQSSLAHDLKKIYHGLREHGWARILINNWIDLPLALEMTPDTSQIDSMRPYQTLLLLKSDSKVVEELPVDHSPLLYQFVRKCNALNSFLDLQVITNIPLTQLYRLAAHLVFWKKARVIDTVTTESVYVVDSRANLDASSPLWSSFAHKFPTYDLADILHRLSSPHHLGDHLRRMFDDKQKEDFIQIVVWLLKHEVVVQLHTFIYFWMPAKTSYDDASEDAYQKLIASRSHATLFHRLQPYFNGKHHLKEIMWKENLQHEDLSNLCTTYSDLLVFCRHP